MSRSADHLRSVYAYWHLGTGSVRLVPENCRRRPLVVGPGWSMEALLACTNSLETSCTASTNCPNNVFLAFTGIGQSAFAGELGIGCEWQWHRPVGDDALNGFEPFVPPNHPLQ